jgi:hypothetical protein
VGTPKQSLNGKEWKPRRMPGYSEQIEEIIRHYEPLSWSFAAPAEINPAFLDRVPADLRKTLEHNVKRDLVKIPVNSLLQHFES